MPRTTVTLTDECDAIVKRLMDQRGISFKAALNAAILEGAPPDERPPKFVQKTFRMGALVPIDRAMTLIGEAEDIELIRKRDTGR